jgi:hypothetical protein
MVEVEQPQFGPLPDRGPAGDDLAALAKIGTAAVGIDDLMHAQPLAGEGHPVDRRRAVGHRIDDAGQRRHVVPGRVAGMRYEGPLIAPHQQRTAQAEQRQQQAGERADPAMQQRQQPDHRPVCQLSVRLRPRPVKKRASSVGPWVSL